MQPAAPVPRSAMGGAAAQGWVGGRGGGASQEGSGVGRMEGRREEGAAQG